MYKQTHTHTHTHSYHWTYTCTIWVCIEGRTKAYSYMYSVTPLALLRGSDLPNLLKLAYLPLKMYTNQVYYTTFQHMCQ